MPKVPLAERNDAMETLLLMERTKRSAWAFAFGARHGVCTTRTPASLSSRRNRRAPGRILVRHSPRRRRISGEHSTTAHAMPGIRPLPGDELPMPAKQRVRSHDGRDLPQPCRPN